MNIWISPLHHYSTCKTQPYAYTINHIVAYTTLLYSKHSHALHHRTNQPKIPKLKSIFTTFTCTKSHTLPYTTLSYFKNSHALHHPTNQLQIPKLKSIFTACTCSVSHILSFPILKIHSLVTIQPINQKFQKTKINFLYRYLYLYYKIIYYHILLPISTNTTPLVPNPRTRSSPSIEWTKNPKNAN